MSGSIKFNGAEILQPTLHRWVPRNILGMSGSGHPIYPGVREYELSWQLSSIGDYYQLLESFNNLSGTSTAVIDLPKFNSTGTYDMFSYSGCVLREPEYSEWFTSYYREAKLLISNIRS
jgi:hypothetical protein